MIEQDATKQAGSTSATVGDNGMSTALTLTAQREKSSLTELAEELDTLAEILDKRVLIRSEAEAYEHGNKCLEGMRWISASMRGMALLFDENVEKTLAKQSQELKKIVLAVGDGIRGIASSNESITKKLSTELKELEAVATSSTDEEIPSELRKAFDRVQSIVFEVKNHVCGMTTELRSAEASITVLEVEMEEALENALYDKLTHVYMRGPLEERLENALDNGNADDAWCFLLIDIDRFKTINDQYGHNVGDAALIKTARIIERCLSSKHGQWTVGRYGGDEFAVILQDVALEESRKVAQGICEALDAARWVIRRENSCTISITVSIGVTEYQAGDEITSLLDRADKALYQAKHEGRNRVVVFESLHPMTERSGQAGPQAG